MFSLIRGELESQTNMKSKTIIVSHTLHTIKYGLLQYLSVFKEKTKFWIDSREKSTDS